MIRKLIAFVFVIACSASAQQHRFPHIDIVNTLPSGSCSPANNLEQYAGDVYVCDPNTATWRILKGSGEAGNPAGVTNNVQCNGGGIFGVCSGVNSDGSNGLSITGGVSAATVVGFRYAKQWQTGGGNNGIANALANGAVVVADPTYSTTESLPWGGALQTFFGLPVGPKASDPNAMVTDYRYGVANTQINNPAAFGTRNTYYPSIQVNYTGNPALTGTFLNLGGSLYMSNAIWRGNTTYTRNFYNDKTNLNTYFSQFYKYSEAQGGGDQTSELFCFGRGDCAKRAGNIWAYGGSNTQGDENAELADEKVIEPMEVFQGTVSGAPTVASDGTTTIVTAPTQSNGYQGEGRPLIKFPGYNAGYISIIDVSGGDVRYTCASCNWDGTYGTSVKTTLTSAVQNPVNGVNSFPQSNVTVNVASSGLSFTAGNIGCIFDYDYECEKITGSTSTTVTFATLRNPHPVGSYVTTGGLAGYGVELVADEVDHNSPNGFNDLFSYATWNLVRTVVPIMYSTSGNHLFVHNSGNILPGVGATYQGRAYTSMAGSGGTCTPTVSGGVLTAIAVSGGSGYTGGPPQITFSGSWTTAPSAQVTGWFSGGVTNASVISGGSGIAGGLTCSVVTSNPYVIYPMAKTLQVWNAATGQVDGTFQTAPWGANTPSNGDSLEQPHGYYVMVQGQNNMTYQQLQPDVGSASHAAHGDNLVGSWQGNDSWAQPINWTSVDTYKNAPVPMNTLGRGQLLAPDLIHAYGAFKYGLFLDSPPVAPIGYGPALVGAGCGTIGCAAWAKDYYIFSNRDVPQINANPTGLRYNPSTDTYTFYGKNVDLSNVNLALGQPSLTTQAGFFSGKGQNWNPYSNLLTGASWTCQAATTITLDPTVLDPYGGHLPVWKIVTTAVPGVNEGCWDTTSSNFASSVPLAGSVWLLEQTGFYTNYICGNIANENDSGCFTPTLDKWSQYHMVAKAGPNPSFLNRGSQFYIDNTLGVGATFWVFNPVAEQGDVISTSSLINATASSITTADPVNQAQEGLTVVGALTADSYTGTGTGPSTILLPPVSFTVLTATFTCNGGNEGRRASITDSTTATYGATITGGGTNHVPAYCNGTNWVVD